MPTNTATEIDLSATIPVIANELDRNPEGTTARKLAGATGLPLATVTGTLTAMERAGSITRTPGASNGNRKGADLFTVNACDPAVPADDATPDEANSATGDDATPDASDAPNATSGNEGGADGVIADDASATGADDAIPDANEMADTDSADDSGEASGLPEAPVSAVPVSAVPVSGAPAGSRDLRVIIVAGILGDHPDGVSAANVADESGLRSSIVGRALAAMEAGGAAVRLPAGESGVELWTRGEGDPALVSLAQAPTHCVCTCGHSHRIRNTVTARRAPVAPGQNSNGQATLGKNGLRDMVADFLNDHRGHEFSAGTIAKELDRSSGAVSNALAKLTLLGEVVMTSEAPMRYTAAPVADKAPDSEA